MDNNKNNKNAIVLTIIAIATMLVVVIGATFAYLASTKTKTSNSNISATTSGGDVMFMINSGKDIQVEATVENLNDTTFENVADNSTGKVTLMGSSDVAYQYSVNLYAKDNDFEYSSGTCYYKPDSTKALEYDNKSTCEANGDIWVGGDDGKCYLPTDMSLDPRYTNGLECSNAESVWVTEEVAELVLDLYKSDSDKTCSSGVTGVCVNNLNGRTLDSTKTSFSECEGANSGEEKDYEWLPNINNTENGICYTWVASKDITTYLSPDQDTYLEVYNDPTDTVVAVDETNTQDDDYYFAVVTMRNLRHNQIENGSKTFNGKLIYQRIDAED